MEKLLKFIKNEDRIKRINNINDFSNEPVGLICASGEEINFSRIIGINQAAAQLFGYNKSELINRKLNILMP